MTTTSDSFRENPLVPGQEISNEEVDSIINYIFDILGLNVPPALAVIIVAAGCFFIGVIIASVMSAGQKGTRVRILAASPLAFFLTAVFWFPLLNGRLVKTKFGPVDAVAEWALGNGEIHNQLFLLGIVMLLGAMSLPIYQLAQTLLQFFLNLVRKNAAPPATPEQGG